VLRRAHFDLWYCFRPPWDSGISPPELLDFISSQPAGRAIDLGCGSGTNVVTLAQHGWEVTGVDFAPRAIHIARRKAQRAGVSASLITGDVTNLPPGAAGFDLALDLGCFHGIKDHAGYLAAVRRVLKVGGHWLLYAILKSSPIDAGPGLDREALEDISSRGFVMKSRSDGIDRRGRASAWLLYQNTPAGEHIIRAPA
jgi:ubiquinone/menaquinone biosynthesis C-methylase UbiE